MYYFDYASTTKPSNKNIELYTKLLADVYEHPDDHNKAGKLLEEAKSIVLNALNLNNQYEVVFTSGGTEANNLAIIGYAQVFTTPKHFITSNYEHSSVYSSFKYLETLGHQVTYLDATSNGQIDYNQLEEKLTNNTVMVSIMGVQNELGSVNDAKRISDIINRYNQNIIYMSDTVQTVGKCSYQYNLLDIMTISAHKLYAPKGIGAVVYKKNIKITNTIFGGMQQDGIRPGTISVPSAVTLAVAVQTELANLDQTIKDTRLLTDKFINFVNENPRLKQNVMPDVAIVSVSFKTKALSESIITVLNNEQIFASTRSACSKKLNIPSRSLSSIKLSKEEIDRTIRFSFSRDTTETELNHLISKIIEVLEIY